MTTRGPTQHQLIVAALQGRGDWVPGYDLNRVEVVWGGDPYWLSHNASRRARELAEDGTIQRSEIDGVVHYRAQVDSRQQRLAI